MLKASSQKGFSLIEILLVVVLLAILTAIAVPNLIAARKAAHEGRAIAHLKTLNNVQALYYQSNDKFAIIDNLYKSDLLAPGQFIRKVNNSNGATEIISDGFYDYSFRYTADAMAYTLDADPKTNLRGSYRYFRYRASRTTTGGAGGAGELILFALPRPTTPPTSAYKIFNP
ncbi:MAG: prepilin-type N-terminal cleavage/methylation domain-containing protein [Blastocatellia bacterium]